MDIVGIFKALADETRIRILNLLRKDILCVCDIEAVLGISQSNASRHLTKLKIAGLITGEKRAQWVYYNLDAETLAKHSFVNELITKGFDGQPPCDKDLARLKIYRERGGNCEHPVKILGDQI